MSTLLSCQGFFFFNKTEVEQNKKYHFGISAKYQNGILSQEIQFVIFRRVRVRSDGAAVPRHRNSADCHSPNRAADQPPKVMPRPCSPHKVAISRGPADSPEKRRLTTFGSASCVSQPDRKVYIDSQAQRPSPITTRHASLGDHKALEAEALAEVRVDLVFDSSLI